MNLVAVMKTIKVYYPVNLLLLQVIFIFISLILLLEISNGCVPGVATENICLLSFVVFALIMLRAAYLFCK